MVIRIIRFLASLLLVLCTPVLLITSIGKWATLNPATYAAGHAKYGVAAAMGVSPEQVKAATEAIVEYLQSAPDSLPGLLIKHGANPGFFSARDMLHFVDVHGVVQVFFQTQLISALLAAVCFVAVIVLYRECRDEKVASRILWGSGLTVALLVIMALISFTNFDTVFLDFHYIVFDNNNWILDPRVDRLIVMFPPYLFYDMMLQTAVQTLVAALGVAVVAAGHLFVKRRGRRSRSFGYR